MLGLVVTSSHSVVCRGSRQTSCGWCIGACGWASKPGQEHVLAVRITHEGFNTILSQVYWIIIIHIGSSSYIPYTYKFLMLVNFEDVTNPAFSRFYSWGSLIILLSNWCKPKFCQWNFEDENFADNQLTMKTSKITSLEILYIYGT